MHLHFCGKRRSPNGSPEPVQGLPGRYTRKEIPAFRPAQGRAFSRDRCCILFPTNCFPGRIAGPDPAGEPGPCQELCSEGDPGQMLRIFRETEQFFRES
jgi:hypothetical protein